MSDALAEIQRATFAAARDATATSFPAETRLTGAQLARYLDRRVFGVLATTRPDGRPHAAMTSYFRRDSVFWLPAVTGSVRERNLTAQPWASLVVAEGDRDAHVMVTAEGPAAVVDPAAVPAPVRALVDGDWATRWIRLTAERVLSYRAAGAAV